MKPHFSRPTLTIQLLVVLLCFCNRNYVLSATWSDVGAQLDAYDFITSGCVLVGNVQNGTIYSHIKGNWSLDTGYFVASSSKWVSAMTIVNLMKLGVLSPTDNPQKYISWWTNNASDPRSQITLDMLLSFKSGFIDEPDCTGNNSISMEACVNLMYTNGLTYTPGTNFYYASVHLMIAGLMAVKATNISDWNTVFGTYLKSYSNYSSLLSFAKVMPAGTVIPLQTASFFSPTTGQKNQNPAGSLYTSTTAYGDFLRAVLGYSILPDYLPTMQANHLENVTIAYSPVNIKLTPPGFIPAWKYGWGEWVECNSTTFDASCQNRSQGSVSSPGKFGFYPWVDYKYGYYGIVGNYNPIALGAYAQSVQLGLIVRPIIQDILTSMATTTTTAASTSSSSSSSTTSGTSSSSGSSSSSSSTSASSTSSSTSSSSTSSNPTTTSTSTSSSSTSSSTSANPSTGNSSAPHFLPSLLLYLCFALVFALINS